MHPSQVVSEIILSPEALSSLPMATILRTINSVSFSVEGLDMASEGLEGTTTVWASRKLMPTDQH